MMAEPDVYLSRDNITTLDFSTNKLVLIFLSLIEKNRRDIVIFLDVRLAVL